MERQQNVCILPKRRDVALIVIPWEFRKYHAPHTTIVSIDLVHMRRSQCFNNEKLAKSRWIWS
jgi:hypothetical protein